MSDSIVGVNPFLAERLAGVAPNVPLSLILEAPPSKASQVSGVLQKLGVVQLDQAFSQFSLVYVPAGLIDQISKIDGVTVHYNMLRAVVSSPAPPSSSTTLPIAPLPATSLTVNDPILGPFTVSPATIPSLKPFAAPPPPQFAVPNTKIIPTGLSKAVIVDVTTNLTGRGVLIAIIDTGATPVHPQLFGRNVQLESTVPEPPFDMMGHGMWCTCAAAGNPFDTRFGRVEGIATGADVLHIKSLTTVGMGTSFGIIKAMELAYNRGAKVVSMSLGGDLQGSIFDDPEVKVVEGLSQSGMIFVIAAGNSGPGSYTIGSPGAAPSAITVGSISMADSPLPAYFSSRGPQAAYYSTHSADAASATQIYGDNFLKPDVLAPGGGRADASATPDEVLYSGCTGWFDGYYDLAPDGFEGMHGTSQATPAVAGFVALLVEGGLVKTSNDFKATMAKKGIPKDSDSGYGLVQLSYFAGS